MSSERDNRQRAAARARLEREMAARREAARRKRLLQARIGAGVAGRGRPRCRGLDHRRGHRRRARPSRRPPPPPPRPCVDTLDGLPAPRPTRPPRRAPTAAVAAGRDQGRRHAADRPCPASGFQVITFDTNLGKIKVEMDLSKTPCTADSIAHLAEQGLLRQHRRATAWCTDDLRAAVRRPERHRLRRRDLPLRRREPADGQAARLPRRRRGDGQHRPAGQQRHPVLLRVRHQPAAGQLLASGAG